MIVKNLPEFFNEFGFSEELTYYDAIVLFKSMIFQNLPDCF